MSAFGKPIIKHDPQKEQDYETKELKPIGEVFDGTNLVYTITADIVDNKPEYLDAMIPKDPDDDSADYLNNLTFSYEQKLPISRVLRDNSGVLALSRLPDGISTDIGTRSNPNPSLHFKLVNTNGVNVLVTSPPMPMPGTLSEVQSQVIASYNPIEAKELPDIPNEIEEQLVLFPINHDLLNDLPELDLCIATISSSTGYAAPYLYSENDINIAFGPIYGQVDVFRYNGKPKKDFYLQYERNTSGNLVGKVIRTPFMPLREEPQMINGIMEEVETDVDTGRVYYVRYYNPLGDGKQVTKAEYDKYYNDRQALIGEYLPKVLSNVVGY